MDINLYPPPRYRDPIQVRANQAIPGGLIAIDGKEREIRQMTLTRTERGETCVITWSGGGDSGNLTCSPDAYITTRLSIPEPAKYAVLRRVNDGDYDNDSMGMFVALDEALEAHWVPQAFRNTLVLRAKQATNGRILDLAVAYVDLLELVMEGYRAVSSAEAARNQR